MIFEEFATGGKNDIVKWKTLSHNGVIFQPLYEKHNIPLLYENEKIILPIISEEYATIYAKLTDSEYVKNKTLRKNFFNDWKKILKSEGVIITDFDKCDFSLIYKFLLDAKIEKSNYSNDEKEKIKQQKLKEEEKYKYAFIDGKKEEVGNFRVEHTGIMIGHGCNPKIGKLKMRVVPEDITVNIDKNSKIPELPEFYKNHKWGKILHDPYKEWLYSWYDNLTNKTKYVFLSRKSSFKASSDKEKFDKSRELKTIINKMRSENYVNIQSSDLKLKQLALALYLIDVLAIRVGNEKNENETETYGACSLKIFHVDLSKQNELTLNFVGKDSVNYKNTIKIDNVIYDGFITIYKNKEKKDDLFDLITPIDLNIYLKTFMKNLTAKTFRTFNASVAFQNEISKINEKYKNVKKDEIIYNKILNEYIMANITVAKLCNHQKKISKTLNEQIEKINDKIKELKDKKETLTDKKKISKINLKIKEEKNKKNLKMELSDVNMATSKLNYIDPRITIAFIKLNNIPDNISEKIFPSKQKEIFNWALDVDKNWVF